jgi:hypothetical protein
MAPGPVKFGDDVRDRVADAGNLREPAFFDQDVERNCEAARLSAARE